MRLFCTPQSPLQLFFVSSRFPRDLIAACATSAKALQEPGQHHFDGDMILGNIDMTGRRLPHGTDAEDHPVAVPALLVNFQHWYITLLRVSVLS